MNSEVPYLRINVWRRPWWLLGLMGRWTQIEMHPPPDATFAEVIKWAELLRAKGAIVEVVQ